MGLKTKVIVSIRWPNGIKADIGELELEYIKDGMVVKSRWNMARRFGWAMIKQGFILMMKMDRKKKEE